LRITDLIIKITSTDIGFNFQDAIGRVREDFQSIDTAILNANIGGVHDEVVTCNMLRCEGYISHTGIAQSLC